MAGKRPSAKAIGLMFAVLVLGGFIGALGTLVAGHMHRGPRRVAFIDQLSQQLQLSAQQRTQIQSILADGHKRFDAVFQQSRDQARSQYDAVRQDIHARIRAVLTPAQQTKFDDFLQRLNAEHKAHPPPPGPGRRGRGPGRRST
jgi:Spy/CpxP family protein refolding chaperone